MSSRDFLDPLDAARSILEEAQPRPFLGCLAIPYRRCSECRMRVDASNVAGRFEFPTLDERGRCHYCRNAALRGELAERERDFSWVDRLVGGSR